jgi:hypothetical protein
LGLADECADLSNDRGASQGVTLNAKSTKRVAPIPTNDFEIKSFNPDGDFVTISVSNIYTPLNMNAESQENDTKVKGKRGPKKSENTKSASANKRGTKRRAKDLDDEEFTCSYDETSHSGSSSEKAGRGIKPLKKRARFTNSSTSEPLEFTDVLTYDSMDGTDSMTTTPLRRDSCSEDTLGEILASTCGTPVDESWSQLDCNTVIFPNPLEEEPFPTTTTNAPAQGDQFYFGEMSPVVSFIDDAFDDSNIFSY